MRHSSTTSTHDRGCWLFSNVSTPHMKPEDYDGTTDWLEYKVYFDQLAELYGLDEERKAVVKGI